MKNWRDVFMKRVDEVDLETTTKSAAACVRDNIRNCRG